MNKEELIDEIQALAETDSRIFLTNIHERRILYSEIIELCQQSQWISIDDRLPDKKVLATYKNSAGKNRIIVAEHFKRFEIESMGESDDYDEYCEDKDAYFYREGWYEQQDNWGEYASIFVNEGDVTHWQPLPEKPNED